MNNRPLFWAVMCFALGEVVYIVADRGNKIGTTLVVLVFVVLLLGKFKMCWKKKIIFPLMMMLGLARILVSDWGNMGNVLFGEGEYINIKQEYQGYTVTYHQGVLSESGSNKGHQYLASQVEISGTGIVDNISRGTNGLNVTVLLKESKTDRAEISSSYKIIIYGVEEQLIIGDGVCVSGIVYDFVPSNNPGEFRRGDYYNARGIVGYSTAKNMELKELCDCVENKSIYNMGEFIWYKLKNALYNLRDNIDRVLGDICLGDSKALYSGILLGNKSEIPDNDMLLFRLVGIAHIFAISGLHIGIVGGALYRLLRKLGLRFFSGAIIAMVVTLMYGVMTGFSFSTIRAIVMLGLALGGEIIGRRYDMLTGMTLALFGIFIVEPFRILDGGLILSFGAVAGVVVSKYIVKLLAGNKNFKKLQGKKYRRLYKIISGLIFSMGITVVTTPLVAYMYFQVPLYSVVINMIVVPLMSVTVFSGMLGLLVGMVSTFFGKLIIFPGAVCLWIYKKLSELVCLLPYNVINIGKPSIYVIIIYYLTLAIILLGINPKTISHVRRWLHNKNKKWISYRKIKGLVRLVIVGIIVAGITFSGFVELKENGEKIIFLDVGQGDGVIIKTGDGTRIAIDIGSTSSDSLGEYVAYPAILSELNGHIDYWFVSHADRDHISGLEYILDSDIDMGITIDNIVIGENSSYSSGGLISKAHHKGVNVIYMSQGDYIEGESFLVTALHPSNTFESEDKNERSLVLTYESASIKVLFTGDMGEEAIMHMLNNNSLGMDYDVVKVPHHGSKYSYSMKFLERINCEVAVISCGIMNSYGHPHKETLEGLKGAGCDIYRTDYGGCVYIEIK